MISCNTNFKKYKKINITYLLAHYSSDLSSQKSLIFFPFTGQKHKMTQSATLGYLLFLQGCVIFLFCHHQVDLLSFCPQDSFSQFPECDCLREGNRKDINTASLNFENSLHLQIVFFLFLYFFFFFPPH